MKFKWPWRRKEGEWIGAKPGPWKATPPKETDYEGNDLWARAFPKPRPLTQYEIQVYRGMAQTSGKQMRLQNVYHDEWFDRYYGPNPLVYPPGSRGAAQSRKKGKG